MNSSVFGVATPCLRPSTERVEALVDRMRRSPGSCGSTGAAWLITSPSGRDLVRDAAAQDAAARGQRRILLRIGRRIDQHGPFGDAEHVALRGSVRRARPFRSAASRAASRRGGSWFRCGSGRGLRRRSDRLPECRAARTPAPAPATCSARRALRWDSSTSRRFISSSSAARCGVGGGSEPVPARPVTSETASTFT